MTYKADSTYEKLKSAVMRNDVKAADAFLQSGEDFTSRMPELFSKATSYGSPEMTELLIANGAEVNEAFFGMTPLMRVAASNKVEIAAILIKAGAEVNAICKEKTALMYSAGESGGVAVMGLLIDCGADASIQDSAGRTALSIAESGSHKERVLLLKEASLGGARKPTYEELLAAVERNDIETVKIFLERGADVDVESGISPLSAAVYRGHVEVASLLLDKGANINGRAPQAYSPLFNAVSGRRIETIRLLIERGADIEIGNMQAGTAMEKAERGEEAEIVQLLKEGLETQRLRAEAEKHGVAAERQQILKGKAHRPIIRGVKP